MKEGSTQNQYTILAADDQELNLAIIEDYLAPLGYRVIKARNGREALAQIESARPDLVLLDIIMPEIDGYEVCRRVKENPESRDIPIVMVTSLQGTEDMVKALEAGADEFLTKPVNDIELQARVKSLLKKKTLHDQLKSAYSHINNLTLFAENKLAELSSESFNGEDANKHLIQRLLRISADDTMSPTHLLLGKRTGEYIEGTLYSYKDGIINTRSVSGGAKNTLGCAEKYSDQETALVECSGRIYREKECNGSLCEEITDPVGLINNFIVCDSKNSDSLALAFNYGKELTPNDADTLRSFLLLYNVFTTISGKMDEIDGAFKYLVTALARAADANDEETGNHIVRVNEYARVLSEEMKMPAEFVRDIGFFAQMHDVGKIHIHISLLRKPGGLTDEEAKMVRNHTVYGSMILGDEPRLNMAREIALCHQERYDGSGYPGGLRGDNIPISGRIVALADVYDALRSKRSYKPAFSHQRTVEIITKGDGKTTPEHFDPLVLEAFINREKEFERIYHNLTDEDRVPS